MDENEIFRETLKRDENISNIEIPQETLAKWQEIVNIIAELLNIPAALIMRIIDSEIEVFVSSENEDNPYNPKDKEYSVDSGLYCETVVKTNKKILVPNALADETWENNPDTKLGMISYLGFPILLPNGKAFGTICVLDNKENYYSQTYEKLINNFRGIVQSELELIYMNKVLGNKNNTLLDYIAEIKTLRGIIPICANCKKIRDDKGFWVQVEKYIQDHSEVKFSHSICNECVDILYGDEDWYQKS